MKLDYADAPSLTFATSTPVGSIDTTDGPQTVTVQNIGNAPLTFQPFVAGNLLDAVLASPGETGCTALDGAPIPPGASCTLGIEFDPAQTGAVNGHVNVVDNALNAASPTYATQTIGVQGKGTGVATPAALTTPTPSCTLSGSSVTFDWTTGTGVTEYDLHLGTSKGAWNLYASGPVTKTTASVTGLPTYGATIYATLLSMVNGVYQPEYYTYTEAGTPVLATLTTPTPSTTLSGSSVTFDWTAGGGITEYDLHLGTTKGAWNLYASGGVTKTSVSVTGLPTYGATIYATLLSMVNGAWQPEYYTYTEAGTPVLATLTTPTPSSTLTGSSATFDWTAGGGVTGYDLHLGTSKGAYNLYASGGVTKTSVSVTGLPTYGATIYATLLSMVNGVYQPEYYTYTEAGTPVLATLTTPTPSTTLSGSSVTFDWSAGGGITEYDLHLGTSKGAYNLYASGGVTKTSVLVTGLPTNGETIYATLLSMVNGVWQSVYYTYTAAP